MELNQNNQSIILSISEVKNNSGDSSMWEFAKKSQIKSANRLHLDGKNNTSKDIIENFTKGLERETLQNKTANKSTISKKFDVQNTYNKLSKSADNNNIQQNLNQQINSKLQKRFFTNQKTELKNLKAENLVNTQSSKLKKIVIPKLENSLVLHENNQKKKWNNKNFSPQSKKQAKIIEMGHTKIIHEIDRKLNNEENNSLKFDELNAPKEVDKVSRFDEKIENSKIEINYTENEQIDSENGNSNEDFKESLLHLLNHFNTKINGEINGDHFGEFEIKTELGNLSVTIKKENNHITININSDLIYQLEGQIESIKSAISEKMPEIDSIMINTTNLSFDYQPEKSSNSNKKKTNLNQDSIFKLNFLA